MPPLDRAFALPHRPHGPVPVREDLHFDVPPRFEVALAEHRRVAECGLCLTSGRGELVGQFGQVADDPHAAAAAPGGGLDQHGQVGLGHRGRVQLGQHRHAGVGHDLLGLDLRTHPGDGVRVRPDPGQSRVEDRPREFGVLREKPVPRVDRVGPRRAGSRDDRLAAEVRVGGGSAGQVHRDVGLGDVRAVGVRVGEHGDGAEAGPPAGGEHPAGDLAAIGDEHGGDGVGTVHCCLTSGRHRSCRCPRSARWRWPTGTSPPRCGCRAGR